MHHTRTIDVSRLVQGVMSIRATSLMEATGRRWRRRSSTNWRRMDSVVSSLASPRMTKVSISKSSRAAVALAVDGSRRVDRPLSSSSIAASVAGPAGASAIVTSGCAGSRASSSSMAAQVALPISVCPISTSGAPVERRPLARCPAACGDSAPGALESRLPYRFVSSRPRGTDRSSSVRARRVSSSASSCVTLREGSLGRNGERSRSPGGVRRSAEAGASSLVSGGGASLRSVSATQFSIARGLGLNKCIRSAGFPGDTCPRKGRGPGEATTGGCGRGRGSGPEGSAEEARISRVACRKLAPARQIRIDAPRRLATVRDAPND